MGKILAGFVIGQIKGRICDWLDMGGLCDWSNRAGFVICRQAL